MQPGHNSKQSRSMKKLRNVKKAVEEFDCPVCCEPFIQTGCRTQVASCGHTLCFGCWVRLPMPLTCPVCRAVLRSPPVPNFSLNTLLDGVKNILKRFQSEEVAYDRAIREEEKRILKEERASKKMKKNK